MTRQPVATLRPSLPQALIICAAALPWLVLGVLDVLRPDMMTSVLGFHQGYWLVVIIVGLTLLDLAMKLGGSLLINARWKRGAPGRTRAIAILAVPTIVLVTLPACFVALFGPVVILMSNHV